MDEETEFEDRCRNLDNREDRNIERYLEKEASYDTGSDTIILESKLRQHKKDLNWEEPETRYRWDSETGRAAALKRWNKEEKK